MQSIDVKKDMMHKIENLGINLENALSEIQDEVIMSDIAAANYLRLMGTHIRGILYLANHDLFLQPALSVSRIVIEVFGRLMWLIEPNEIDDRQIRFIALLENEKGEHELYYKNLKIEKTKDFLSDKEVLDDHIKNIEKTLPSEYSKVNFPSTKKLLKEIGEEHLYPLFRRLSLSVHGNHGTIWAGITDAEERINQTYWYTPLFICFYVTAVAGEKYLNRFGGNTNDVITREIKTEIEEILQHGEIW